MKEFGISVCQALLFSAGFAVAIVANDYFKWLFPMEPILAWFCIAPIAGIVLVLLAAFTTDNRQASVYCGWASGILAGWIGCAYLFGWLFLREGWDIG